MTARVVATIQPQGEWQEQAICRQVDPDLFFPAVSQGRDGAAQTRDAKAICARCDVRRECLQWALDNDQIYGVWGGLSEKERRAIKRRTAK